MLSSETKILLLVFIGLILVFLLYNGKSEGFTTETKNNIKMSNTSENITNPQPRVEAIDNRSNMSTRSSQSTDSNVSNQAIPYPPEDVIKYFAPNDYAPPEKDWLSGKFNSRNKARSCDYKRSDYAKGIRGALGPSDWDIYFDQNNDVIGGGQGGSGDNFLPIDETNNKYSIFKSNGRAMCGSNQDCEPEALFDADKLLPQEVNDDWYEVMPEPVSVKNRHLINISQPIGLNTVGSSKKNANYDLRAAPVNPKYVTSPWLNSSIDPDLSIKPIM